MKEKLFVYRVPFAYERYGYLEVKSELPLIEKEIHEAAEKQLENMTQEEMEACTSYLQDSEEIDYDGDILDEKKCIRK